MHRFIDLIIRFYGWQTLINFHCSNFTLVELPQVLEYGFRNLVDPVRAKKKLFALERKYCNWLYAHFYLDCLY